MAMMSFAKFRSALNLANVKLLTPEFECLSLNKRGLWGYWLNAVFNSVDTDRIKEVGPDRACAEWLLKNGGSVKWKNTKSWEKDYNALPAENIPAYTIEEIDATESSIMHVGFPHLKGLKHLRKIILHRCPCIEDKALQQLVFAKATLQDLQVSSCGNVTDLGLEALKELKNLKRLHLFDLDGVRKKKESLQLLQQSLPTCNITFPDAAH